MRTCIEGKSPKRSPAHAAPIAPSSRRSVGSELVCMSSAFAIGCGGAATSGGATQPPPPPQPTPTPKFQITTSSIPLALVGTPYSVQLTTANGNGALTWTTSGITPPDLKLSSSGLLTGTPTTPNYSFPLTVNVTDSSTPAQSASATFPYGAAGFVVDLRGGQIGVYYNNVIQFTALQIRFRGRWCPGHCRPGCRCSRFLEKVHNSILPGPPRKRGRFT
jgi:hypothetical protein